MYQARDLFDIPLQLARLVGKPPPATNLTTAGQVPDSSFFTNRPIRGVDPAVLARGANRHGPPQGPFKILRVKTKGATPGFISQDARGDTFLVKLDDPDHPELASTAEIVASRIYCALGYFVPETYLITVTGTGDPRFDGRRAIASRFVPGNVLGMYKMDWVRNRREYRALKVAAAWLNDADRSDNNNLAAAENGIVTFYILDFNAALGSWQGRPKPPWRGFRYRWDPPRQLAAALTLGLIGADRQARPDDINSKSLGYIALRFNPDTWHNTRPNTAFDRMTPDDARWMARRIASFSRAQLRAIIEQADLSDPADTNRLLKALLQRRRIILEHYLSNDQQDPQ